MPMDFEGWVHSRGDEVTPGRDRRRPGITAAELLWLIRCPPRQQPDQQMRANFRSAPPVASIGASAGSVKRVVVIPRSLQKHFPTDPCDRRCRKPDA